MFASVDHAYFHDAADFLAHPYTAGAMYATLHGIGGNERPHVFGNHHPLFFLVAGSRCAIAHGQILQLAFTALVAHRAIERSEERRVGKESVSTCRSWWSQYH